MLQDNYTQDLPIFKGVTVKYFRGRLYNQLEQKIK